MRIDTRLHFADWHGSASGASCSHRQPKPNKQSFIASVTHARTSPTNTMKGVNMSTNANTNAAIYCRVSTRQQAEDGSSLGSQEVACRRLAVSQGFTITQVFTEDFPGTELARPQLDQLRSGVKSGTYAAIFCYATDRLSRSPVHISLSAGECQKC